VRLHLFLTVIFRFLQTYHLQHNSTYETELNTKLKREMTYIRNAVAYIRYNFRDPNISITKIAAAVCLSPNYFGTIFKKHMGETCLSYIKKLRLSFATVLLQNSALTIAEISDKCGYSNVPYFISDFRMAYGMPPKKHRDSHSHMTDPLDEPSNL
ncbi:MAG: helix-turn-helix transcriptional regulator, partial [Clostridia bacterium]|nr:helix-turn-helix transcriptional regulator [Clostridia bacterium]